MYPYWLLFAYFAVGSVTGQARPGPTVPFRSVMMALGIAIIGLMVGLRVDVGLDWLKYSRIFDTVSRMPFDRAIGLGDPGYIALNWVIGHAGGSFWMVNLVCGSIFALGLSRFVRTQPEPWLATLAAVPYLIVVVAMGYTRQGVAIGITLAGLAALFEGRSYWKFVAYIVVATMFHASAIVVLPIAGIGVARTRWMTLPILAAAAYALYTLQLGDQFDRLYRNYIEAQLQSQGALVRIILCVIPALAFFLFRRRFRFGEIEGAVWRNYSIVALLLLVLLFVLPSSTAVDRVGLYVIPLQLGILARMSLFFDSYGQGRAFVLVYSFLVLFVWLNFAQFADGWLPYRMVNPFA